jgi:glutamate-1-semialdehyde 2,1-aminomutase
MQAIRCARAVTGRDVLARFAGSYHGTSDSVTDPDLPGIARSERESTLVLPQGDLAALQSAFATRGPQIAAVLMDLMPNRAGLQPADPGFVKAVRELTERHGALMIVDEVVTFRLAFGGLTPSYDVEPDLVAFGKAIGGGLPVGALAGRAEIMGAFAASSGPRVAWGGTFSANLLTVAAGQAALTAYDPAAIEELNRLGDELRRRIQQAGVQVNGRGSLMRIMEPVDGAGLWWALYRRGVLVGRNALIALSTPMTQDDADIVAAAVVEAVGAQR